MIRKVIAFTFMLISMSVVSICFFGFIDVEDSITAGLKKSAVFGFTCSDSTLLLFTALGLISIVSMYLWGCMLFKKKQAKVKRLLFNKIDNSYWFVHL